jgi:tetratricopeptide (TPR) repeat protein
MILSVRKDVSLKRQGASVFVPILKNIAFRIGDLLQVGNDSAAKVLCSDRGICELQTGTYPSCCTASCKVQIQMLRIGTGPTTPIVKRTDLPVAEAEQLNRAETSIRQLELSPITTQFLITKLYSGWKLEETNQELDRLTIQLGKPEAKEELQDLYLPVIRKTGDMHLKLNRIGPAKELYQININSQPGDSVEKAAAHAGLAQAYNQAGDKNEAVRNLEMAKQIYVKQGDKKAVAATEKEIANTKLERLANTTIPKTKIRSQPPKQ